MVKPTSYQWSEAHFPWPSICAYSSKIFSEENLIYKRLHKCLWKCKDRMLSDTRTLLVISNWKHDSNWFQQWEHVLFHVLGSLWTGFASWLLVSEAQWLHRELGLSTSLPCHLQHRCHSENGSLWSHQTATRMTGIVCYILFNGREGNWILRLRIVLVSLWPWLAFLCPFLQNPKQRGGIALPIFRSTPEA